MAVNGIDHINIQTDDLPGTVRFFADILDLTPGAPPGGLDPSQVTWMFDAAGKPLVHLSARGMPMPAADRPAATDTGAIHHVALQCSDYGAMVETLARLGMPHQRNEVASIGLKQLFVTDPNGVLLELNFRGP